MAIDAIATTRTTWQVDPIHSSIGFQVRHMLVTSVRGHFKHATGTIVLDEADPAASSVEVAIDASSIDTRQEQRDAHLRTGDFLLTEEHPQISFKSTRVEVEAGDRGKVTGELTMRGVTHPVTLDVELTGRGKNTQGVEIIGFEAVTRINRKDWGVSYNAPLEAGGFALGEQVKIEIALEAVRQ